MKLFRKDKIKKRLPSNEIVSEEAVRRDGFNFPEMIIIMMLAIIFGFFLGNFINIGKVFGNTNNNEIQEFVDTYDEIVANYYDDVDKDSLIDAAIQGMISSLDDPYASYFSGSSSDTFTEPLSGTYNGIGIEVAQTDAGIMVNRIFDDTPAASTGLKEGDRLIAINGEDITSLSLSEAVAKIKDSATGTEVTLTVMRGEEKLDFKVKTTTVINPLVTSSIYSQDGKMIGYIKIDIFAANIADQFESTLDELEEKNIDSLIIDVRDNPGGYLGQTEEILSLFMDNKKVLYQLQSKNNIEKVYGLSKKVDRIYPVVVLINENSASAAEILASAFKENYNSEIVGVTSYGKGTVQKLDTLSNGDTFKYTMQKWLTPNGNDINEKGVTPTKEVTLTSTDKDDQLETALQILSE